MCLSSSCRSASLGLAGASLKRMISNPTARGSLGRWQDMTWPCMFVHVFREVPCILGGDKPSLLLQYAEREPISHCVRHDSFGIQAWRLILCESVTCAASIPTFSFVSNGTRLPVPAFHSNDLFTPHRFRHYKLKSHCIVPHNFYRTGIMF